MEGGARFRNSFNERYGLLARKVIRELSENSRVRITELSEKLGVSRRTAALKIANVERELGISYTIELDEASLGLNRPHLIWVKFRSRPDWEDVKSIVSNSYIPQIAFRVSGTYHMAIYANALSGTEYAHWERKTQMLLAAYKPDWRSSEIAHRQLGFFPLRNEALWRTGLTDMQKRMLCILNENSRISFNELAKALRMNVNTAVYNFRKLVSEGYVKSFTASMNAPRGVSLMTFFSRYTPSNGFEHASSIARREFTDDDQYPLVSKYLIASALLGSSDFFTMGAFDSREHAYRYDVMYHKGLFRKFGVQINYGIIKEMLLGRLPIRSIDAKRSYNTLVWSTT